MDLVGTRDLEAPVVAMEELLKWDGIDAVISLGIDGRQELVRKLIESTRKVDPQSSPAFLEHFETFNQEYEKQYVRKIVGLMETYEKPIIGVSLVDVRETVRPVDGSRYSGLFYQSPESAVNVLARMVAYQDFIARW